MAGETGCDSTRGEVTGTSTAGDGGCESMPGRGEEASSSTLLDEGCDSEDGKAVSTSVTGE